MLRVVSFPGFAAEDSAPAAALRVRAADVLDE
jgi:hypothetical protein